MPDGIDPHIVERAQKGDVSSVTTIFEHFHQSVFRYFFYRVGDRQAAEDLTSAVFLQVVRYLPAYKPEGVPFSAWIFKIARNLANEHFRTASAPAASGVDVPLGSRDAADGLPEGSLTTEKLRSALSRLGHDQRDVIILRLMAGLPIAEVAISLNKSLAEVKALQRRGLAILNAILADGEVMHARD